MSSHSLTFQFLDNGMNGQASKHPMASSSFGAESGSYFLKSEALPYTDDYQLDVDPRKERKEKVPQKGQVKKNQEEKRKRKPSKRKPKDHNNTKEEEKTGAVGAQATLGTNPLQCKPIKWQNLPGCIWSSAMGLIMDLYERFATGQGSLGEIFTKDNRPIYLSILFLLLIFLYRLIAPF